MCKIKKGKEVYTLYPCGYNTICKNVLEILKEEEFFIEDEPYLYRIERIDRDRVVLCRSFDHENWDCGFIAVIKY